MSYNAPPRTILIKRKRDEAPVDSLRTSHILQRISYTDHYSTVVEQSSARKRILTEHGAVFRRVQKKVDIPSTPTVASPTPPIPRRFEVLRESGKLVLVEQKVENRLGQGGTTEHDNTSGQLTATATVEQPTAPTSIHPEQDAPRERKRPNTSAVQQPYKRRDRTSPEPEGAQLREFLAFADEIEQEDERKAQEKQTPLIISPVKKEYTSKYKPKLPTKRYRDRHPEEAKKPASPPPTDPDAMDIDKDYVYDTYIRDVTMSDADNQPTGTVGVIVITDEDEELWETYWQDGSDSSEGYYTDDEDENAEDYYGADYPEDEVDRDDEFDIDPYQYNHGDEEEWDAENEVWSDDEAELAKYPWKREFLAARKAAEEEE